MDPWEGTIYIYIYIKNGFLCDKFVGKIFNNVFFLCDQISIGKYTSLTDAMGVENIPVSFGVILCDFIMIMGERA